MFIDSLTITLPILCDIHGLTKEKAAEKCNICPKHYRNIVHGKSALSMVVLENMCKGYGVLPNDLLILPETIKEVKTYKGNKIAQCFCLRNISSFQVFPVCSAYMNPFLDGYKNACSKCTKKFARKTASHQKKTLQVVNWSRAFFNE